MNDVLARKLQGIGHGVLRYGLVLILLMIGALKWTPEEAEAIRPWIADSPFLSWIYSVFSVQGGSQLIGVFEITAALLIAARRWSPTAAAIGSAMAIPMFLVTLTFLFTTPNQSADAQGFLLKDIFLLGVALWSTGEALQHAVGIADDRGKRSELPQASFSR